MIRQPGSRLPKPRPRWAGNLHLLTLLALPALFVSGCSNFGGTAKTQPSSPPSSPAPPSPPGPPPAPPPAPVSPPSITSNPASETVTVSNSGIFVVAATGTAPFTYQWQKNGVNIPNGTVPMYITPPTQLSDDGSIFVAVVSNSAGSQMSSPAMLSVVGGTARLAADASTLSFGNVVAGSSGTMTVTLTNSGSAAANITGVSISSQAFVTASALAGSAIAPGQSAALSIKFTPPNQAVFSGTIAITSDAPNSPISIPVFGTGIAAPAHSVDLNWAPSTSPDIVGYIVERADQSGGPYTPLTPTPIATTAFTDTTVIGGQTYFYIVVAVDSAGQTSTPSNEAAVTIPFP